MEYTDNKILFLTLWFLFIIITITGISITEMSSMKKDFKNQIAKINSNMPSSTTERISNIENFIVQKYRKFDDNDIVDVQEYISEVNNEGTPTIVPEHKDIIISAVFDKGQIMYNLKGVNSDETFSEAMFTRLKVCK
jgi:lipoate-protein ligase A